MNNPPKPIKTDKEASIYIDVAKLPTHDDITVPPGTIETILITPEHGKYSKGIMLARENGTISGEDRMRMVEGGPVPHATPIAAFQLTFADLIRQRVLNQDEVAFLERLAGFRSESETACNDLIVVMPEESERLERITDLRAQAHELALDLARQ